jgi:PAS domain S-box-containing protein
MWLEETAKAEFDATGRLLRVKGLTRDITERKQAEEKLQKSEQALRELLGALPAAIYVTDAAGRITYCNRSAVDLWGTRPKLAEDRWCDLAQFYHTDGTPVAPEDCPMEIALKQGGVVRGQEVILERHDGTRVPIIPYPTPLHDGTGAIVGAVNMTVDISERKKAELALAERNVQLALAGKAGLVGSYAYDANTEWMQVSEGYVAIQGLPEGTTEIARSRWLANVHPEDRIRMEALRHQSFRQRRPEQSLEYRIVRGGEVRWIESRSFISYGIDGRPQRVIGVNIDVTERKRAEEHQRVLVAELDHRVKNVLATVSAVAAHTLDASSSMAHFVAALDGRLRSMASTHELLSDRQWRGMPLAELLQRELAPYARSDNTEICGPDVMLTVEAGQGVAMVLHELVTNAAKHGALSTRKGRVSVRWYQPLNGRVPDQLVIEWQETGGPSVKAPSKSGYGTGVIEDLLPYEFGGTVDLAFASGGVRCRLEIPAAWITSVSRLHTNSNEFYPARTISRH